MKSIRVGVFGDRIDGAWCSPSFQIRLLSAWQDRKEFKTILIQQISDLENIDVIIFQRMSFLDAKGKEILSLALKRGIPSVLDIDDDFEAVSKLIGHEAQSEIESKIDEFNGYLHCFSQVWVSTSSLGRSIGNKLGVEVRLRPTVPPKSIELLNSARIENERTRSFLYFGTSTHIKDFEIVQETLAMEARQGRMRASVVGVLRGVKPREGINSIQVNRKIATRYNSFIDFLNRLGPFDIGVAPLVDNEVNKSKSGLKVFEYAALGILPIASNVEAYSWMKNLSLENLLVTDGINNWQKSIEHLNDMKFSEFEELRLESVSAVRNLAQILRDENLENDYEDLMKLI